KTNYELTNKTCFHIIILIFRIFR
ncbi:hypothetical protein A5848_001832, partial [Enterococcus faecium]